MVGDLKTRLAVANRSRRTCREWKRKVGDLHSNLTRVSADGDEVQLWIVGDA